MAAFIAPLFGLLDRVLPDKAQSNAAKAALVEMQLKGDLDAAAAQVQTNIVEAQSKSTFVAGWRPFVGWVCGVAFAYAFIVQPLLQFILVALHSTFDVTKLPQLSMAEISPVLLGMLGLGAARTVEKVMGVNAGH